METTSDSSARSEATSAAAGPVTAGFGLHNMCDMCALPISEDELFQTELTAQGATCPTMMAFHRACYEAAAELWIPEGEDSTCRVDPLFPETAQWNQMQHAAQEIDG